MNPLRKLATPERVLPLEDIQGIAVPGFLKPHQRLITVRHAHDAASLADVRNLLLSLSGQVANGLVTLRDRRAYRPNDAETPADDASPDATSPKRSLRPLVAIGFTYRGLLALTADADSIPSEAFKAGLPARSKMLGDPVDSSQAGHPSRWVVGSSKDEPDFMIIVAGDKARAVRRLAAKLKAAIRPFAIKVTVQPGDRLRDPNAEDGDESGLAREHFGFPDGISQPGIRGLASNRPDDFITDRTISPIAWPASAMMGRPGQDLVWPGEFVLGHEKAGVDPLRPGSIDAPIPAWTRNGSFLVYRRLRQDVLGFWESMELNARRLAATPGFEALNPESLAAHLVGRRRDGAPLSRLPGWRETDGTALGRDSGASNHFFFDSDTPRLPLRDGQDVFPQAKADPLGQACPLASHIRKVNPRDAVADTGGTTGIYSRRILRVGVPYGRPCKDPRGRGEPHDADRGVLFLSIQASIENHFEFLQAHWMNDDRRPRAPSGHDMIAGQDATHSADGRQCTIFGTGGEQGLVRLPHPTVTPTGGGYFFVPSLTALREVLAKQMV